MARPDPCIFVFGSNRQGIHGAGAALWAKKYRGAIQGQGEGRQGQSYAIPTKATPWVALPLEAIKTHVETFLEYAEANPSESFILTPIGCGFAGYKPEQIAPMFLYPPHNVILPNEFYFILRKEM